MKALQVLMIVAVTCSVHTAWAQTLSEQETVALALERNPSLRAVMLELRASQEAVRAAEAEYLPSLTIGLGGGHNESLNRASAETPSTGEQIGLDLGLGYRGRWGTQVAVVVGGAWNARAGFDDSGDSENLNSGTTYGLDARVEVRQPLLRGAGRDVGEAGIRSARLGRTAAELAQETAISALLRDVLNAHWELWYAQAALEVQRTSLALAEQQLTEAEARATELGTLAPADVLRFTSELASIEESVAESEANRRFRAIELGRLLGLSPEQAVALDVADVTPAPEAARSLEEVVALASTESSDLRQLAAELELARDRVLISEDATLPRLDLTGSIGLGALWDQQSVSSLDTPWDRPAISGLVGLELELPLGNGRARASLAEARLDAEAAEVRFEARRGQLEAEAAIQVTRLETAVRRAALSERTAAVAAQLAEAERGRLRLGTTTPYQVLEAQATYRETELRHLRALVDGALAAFTLQHLTGELLEQYAALTAER